MGSIPAKLKIKVHDTYVEPMFFYSIILGLPASKKSPAIQLFKQEICEFIKRHPDALKINNS